MKTRSIGNTMRRAMFTLVLCAAGSANAADGEVTGADDVWVNDVYLNGIQVNGIQVNGIQVNGIQVNGIQVNGIQVNGIQVNGIQVNGTVLEGVSADDGALIGGEDLVGAELVAVRSDGHLLPVRIAALEPTADPEIWAYEIEVLHGDGWRSACGYREASACGGAAGGAIPAYALSGRWDNSAGTETGGDHVPDETMFTFACETSVLAECLLMGYAPWRSAVECTADGACQELPLRPFHQACTRMLRADYCGDGTPHTRSGTYVDVWDAFVQDPAAAGWPLEAEWTPNGAHCMEHPRWVSGSPGLPNRSMQYVLQNCPEILGDDTCGTELSTFHTEQGYATDLDERCLLRNASCVPASPGGWPACLPDVACGD